MANTDLNPAEQLHALLSPTTDEGQRLVAGNQKLQELSSRYKHMLESGDPAEADTTLGGIVRELNQENLFEPNAERVLEALKNAAPLRQEENPIETPGPEAPTLADFLAKKNDDDNSGLSDITVAGKAKETYRVLQKDATLKAFEDLLNHTPSDQLPDAIENFYHMHLSAAGVLGNQYSILLAQTSKLYKNNKNGEKFDALEKEAQDEIGKLRQAHIKEALSPDQLAQKERENAHARNLRALSDPGKRDELLKNARSVFDEEWKRQQARAVDHVVRRLRGVGANYYTITQGVDELPITITTTQQVTQETPPEPIPQNPPRQQQAKGGQSLTSTAENIAGKGAKRVGRQILRQGEEQVARAALTTVAGPTAGPVIIGCLVILGIFLFIFVIIFVVLGNFGGGNTNTAQADTSNIANAAKSITDHLCRTYVIPGKDFCFGDTSSLLDRLNPFHFTFPNNPYTVRMRGSDIFHPNGRYYCTDLVIDSYNLAGNKLSESSGCVGSNGGMIDFFRTHSGYEYLPFSDTGSACTPQTTCVPCLQTQDNRCNLPTDQAQLLTVQPGFAIFFTGGNPQCGGEVRSVTNQKFIHTGIVKSITLDKRPDGSYTGNGVLQTYEANAGSVTGKYQISDWHFPTTGVGGFGGLTKQPEISQTQ